MRTIILHEHFASSPGVDWNELVEEARREAAREYGTAVSAWKLEGMYEYDNEVYEEDRNGRMNLVDIEARIVVRYVKPLG